MAWNRTASVNEPPPERRRGRATAMVVLELGLDEVALADALTWARGRADELLAALDDAELRALLEPEPRDAVEPGERARLVLVEDHPRGEGISPCETPDDVAPALAPSAGAERRTTPRYSLVEPAVVTVESWQELVALYTKDIGCGGMFVQTDAPPQRDAHVAVQLLLPEDAGALDFEGVVVHVVTPEQAATSGRTAGFGLQFSGLTAERRRALQRLIEQAEAAAARPRGDGPTLQELGFTCAPTDRGSLRLTVSEAEHQQMQELRSELAAMAMRGDLEVLGLSSASDLDEMRDAFERLGRRWHPSVAHRDASPEIRRLATEIFLRIEQAYRRLREAPRAMGSIPPPPPYASTPRPRPRPAPVDAAASTRSASPPPERPVTRAAHDHATEAPAREAAPPTRRPRSTPPPVHPSLSPMEADVVMAQQRARMARRLVSNLVDRSERLATQLKRREQEATPPRPSREEHRTLVDEAMRLVADKRYAEAAQRLELAVQRKPELRTRVLLCVVQARQALTERDFPRARARYEAVLQLDPGNELAQRELLMLSAMVR